MEQLKQQNKTSVVLTNSPKMKEDVHSFLGSLGIPRNYYLDAHSSGQ